MEAASVQVEVKFEGETFVVPQVENQHKLMLELRLTPRALRADAVQEAWLAHLEGRSARTAVNTFVRRWRRERNRTVQRSVLEGGGNGARVA